VLWHDIGTIFLLLYPRLDSDTCDKSAKHNCQNVFPVHFTIFAQRSDVRNVVVRGLTASASMLWEADVRMSFDSRLVLGREQTDSFRLDERAKRPFRLRPNC
jgi:hypothetical protein